MKTIHQIPKLKTLLTAAIVSSGLFAIGFHALAEDADYSKIPGMPKLEIMSGNDRWGCEVLLCLANPNGPRAVSECRPPIDKLLTVFLGGIRASFRPARWPETATMPNSLVTALIHALCKAWRMLLKGS